MKQKPPSWLWAAIAVAATIIIGLFDWVTGYELRFFVFYFIPVAVAAWFVGLGASLGIGVFCAVVWAITDVASGHIYSSYFYFYWNTIIHLASFVIIGLTLSKLKELWDQHLKMSAELQQSILKLQKASSEIKTLSGLLPICASCKRIRDDNGYWNQIEAYISEHSQADFSHGICPDCLKKLYPDIYEKRQNGSLTGDRKKNHEN